MRNIKAYGVYSTNPYTTGKQQASRMIYQPDEYTLNQMVSLSARALRMLCVIAARVDQDTGISYCPTGELRKLFNGALSNISAAKSELLRADLVSYAHRNHSFYVNSKAFAPLRMVY